MALDFNAELRSEEARRQAAGIPLAVRRSLWARVQRTVERSSGNKRTARTTVFAGAAVALAAGLILVVAALRTPRRLAEFQITRESADFAAHAQADAIEIERGDATLVDSASGVTLEALAPASLRRESGGVRVVQGRVNVTVARRAPGTSPAVILVSHGAIEIMGTVFTIVQGRAGGSVLLREGAIRFRGAGDVLVNLRPGESLSWPLRDVPSAPAPNNDSATPPPPAASSAAPPTLPVAPAPARLPALPPPSASIPRTQPSAKPSSVSSEELLDRVESLRSRHQFEAAARELAQGLSTQPPPMRERLSFELGSLLTHQIHDTHRACAHWAWHQRAFRGGAYRDEVTRSERALGCTQERVR